MRSRRVRLEVGLLARTASPALGVVALFGLALLPRLIGIDLFVTADETFWMRRAANFARAIERGQFERTYQSGHPGVTTMWVAWLGMGSGASSLESITEPDPTGGRRARFMELLVRARLAFAAANSALVVLIALLAWRLFGLGPAALGAVLMALDPFLIAHGQVVHVDALSAGFIVVAMLAAAIYWWGERGHGYLALCAVASGLAVLSKAPSLFLVAFVPLVALSARLAGGRDLSWSRLVLALIAGGIGALVTVVLLWPALWVAPLETVRRAIQFTLETAGQPHEPGNFFLGRPVADPGLPFYPVATVFRLTPVVVGGLAALTILLPPPSLRWQSALLVDYALGFLVFLTLATKKLDRYALPLFPVLAILAGLGLWALCVRARPKTAWRLLGVVLALAVLAEAIGLFGVRPYSLAYYNPLVGGGPAAQRVLLVGWGEGLDQVAAYLNAQPGAASARVAIYYPLTQSLQAMVLDTVQPYGSSHPADYVVDYVNASQRRHTPAEVAGLAPELTVQMNGIEYARVYRLTPQRPVGVPPTCSQVARDASQRAAAVLPRAAR